MDAMDMHRIVESVKANDVRFDTHDLEEFDELLAELDVCEPLSTAEKSVLRRELRPLAEAWQSAEMSRLAAGEQDELLVW